MWFLCTLHHCYLAVDAVNVVVVDVDVDGILAHQSLDKHINVSANGLFEPLPRAS